MFILVLPIALAALALGAVRVKNVTTPRKAPLDVLSVILSAFALRRPRLRPQLDRRGRRGRRAGVGAARRRRRRPGRRSSCASSPCSATTSALLDLRTFLSRNFTISVARARRRHDGAVRHADPAADLPAERARPRPAATGLLLLPGGLLQGVLVADRRPPLRQARPARAARPRHDPRQRRAVGPLDLSELDAASRSCSARTSRSASASPSCSRRCSPSASARCPASSTRTAARSSARCSRSPAPPARPCSSPS